MDPITSSTDESTKPVDTSSNDESAKPVETSSNDESVKLLLKMLGEKIDADKKDRELQRKKEEDKEKKQEDDEKKYTENTKNFKKKWSIMSSYKMFDSVLIDDIKKFIDEYNEISKMERDTYDSNYDYPELIGNLHTYEDYIILHDESLDSKTYFIDTKTYQEYCNSISSFFKYDGYGKTLMLSEDTIWGNFSKFKHITKLTKFNEKTIAFHNNIIDSINLRYKDQIEKTERMLKDNNLSHDVLVNYFTIGEEVYIVTDKHDFGAKITDISMKAYGYRAVTQLEITYSTIVYNDCPCTKTKKHYVPFYIGVKDVDTLSIRKMTDDIRDKLTKRTERFMNIISDMKVKYVNYNGKFKLKVSKKSLNMIINSRIILDHSLYVENHPPKAANTLSNSEDINKLLPIEDFTKDMYFMMQPRVHGHSLTDKNFGTFHIDNISPINFSTNAFDMLVHQEKEKQLIRSLVENVNGTFTDIIENKNGGVIILLYGSPGTGKTYTCQSLSDATKTPLYEISSGEINLTSPEALEKNLIDIFKKTDRWNANLLIDEADVFLEKRCVNDLSRNILVSIFLKYLERFNGVMFLTTNIPSCIDPAFKSRISACIKFDKLDRRSLYLIWNNLLTASKVKESVMNLENTFENDMENINSYPDTYHRLLCKLSTFNMNGREIKTSIRNAQCIAKSKKTDVTLEDLLLSSEVTSKPIDHKEYL
uniref:ATPase AAA-type core domain-containing protein n=1 Tax=viral metagenome TaxID=1070528 RepID=A0A6C0EAS2_9ZZZZ